MNSNYYIPTEACYKNLIHGMWQVDRFTCFHKESIIPKGVVEIIFNFSTSAAIIAELNDKQYRLSDCWINGFNKTPIKLTHSSHQQFFGVMFQPFAVKAIFGFPASEFADVTVDLTLLDPTFRSLWHQLGEQDNFESRVGIILSWLKRNFIDLNPREQLMNNFLYDINQHDLSLKKLAGSCCYSPRHLSRKIFEATGMNTEEILLYKKYLNAVHLIHNTSLSLTSIAYQSQFSDQSHFIKTFKAYTKMTPGHYKRNKDNVKGHIYKDVR